MFRESSPARGKSTPQSLKGLPVPALKRMKLDSMAIFSASDYTGAVSSWYDASGGVCRRRTIPPETTMDYKVLATGVPAYFAPLHMTNEGVVEREWGNMILSNGPFGEVMKQSYDLAILLKGGVMPTFVRMVEGRPLSTHPH